MSQKSTLDGAVGPLQRTAWFPDSCQKAFLEILFSFEIELSFFNCFHNTHASFTCNVSERAVSNGTTKYHWALSLAHCHALLFFMAQFLVVIDNWDKPNQNADPP